MGDKKENIWNATLPTTSWSAPAPGGEFLIPSNPEHRRTEGRVVPDTGGAAVRATGGTRVRGPVGAAAGHPSKGRDITRRAASWCITFRMAPTILSR